MDRDRTSIPRSFLRFPSSFPSLWEEMEDKMNQWIGRGNETGISVSEDTQNIYVEAQLPGIQTNEIDISFHQNTIWIKGEKKEEEENKDKKFYRRAKNSFFYQVELPSQVEENTEQAHHQDGILRITFKKIQQNQMRKIPINSHEKMS